MSDEHVTPPKLTLFGIEMERNSQLAEASYTLCVGDIIAKAWPDKSVGWIASLG